MLRGPNYPTYGGSSKVYVFKNDSKSRTVFVSELNNLAEDSALTVTEYFNSSVRIDDYPSYRQHCYVYTAITTLILFQRLLVLQTPSVLSSQWQPCQEPSLI